MIGLGLTTLRGRLFTKTFSHVGGSSRGLWSHSWEGVGEDPSDILHQCGHGVDRLVQKNFSNRQPRLSDLRQAEIPSDN